MSRTVTDTFFVREPDSSKTTGYRNRKKAIVQCDLCGHETIYDHRHLHRAFNSPCKKCSDRGPIHRTPSGRPSRAVGSPDVLRYGRYQLSEAITHGMTFINCYGSWYAMMRRCYSVKDPAYDDYGGRGIKVCPDWHNPLLFYCDMGDKPDGWSIERLNPDGDYCPENCVWTPSSEQGWNRRGCLGYLFPELSRSELIQLSHELQLESQRRHSKKNYVPRDNPVGRPLDMSLWWNAARCPEMRRETYGPLKSAKCTQNRIRRFEEFWSSLS